MEATRWIKTNNKKKENLENIEQVDLHLHNFQTILFKDQEIIDREFQVRLELNLGPEIEIQVMDEEIPIKLRSSTN